MREAMLTARHCKFEAIHYRYITPRDIEKEPYYDVGVAFKVGLLGDSEVREESVSRIHSKTNTLRIFTYRDLDFKVDDKIRLMGKDYFIERVDTSFYESTQFSIIKRYNLELK